MTDQRITDTLCMAVVALMLATGVLLTLSWLLPEQAAPAPEHRDECVQYSLPDRGLPPCEGSRPEIEGERVNV